MTKKENGRYIHFCEIGEGVDGVLNFTSNSRMYRHETLYNLCDSKGSIHDGAISWIGSFDKQKREWIDTLLVFTPFEGEQKEEPVVIPKLTEEEIEEVRNTPGKVIKVEKKPIKYKIRCNMCGELIEGKYYVNEKNGTYKCYPTCKKQDDEIMSFKSKDAGIGNLNKDISKNDSFLSIEKVEKIKETCENCKYYIHRNCRRYPEFITSALDDWCGEFKRREK